MAKMRRVWPGDVFVVGADWAGAREMDGVAHAHGAGEADDGLVRRTATDVLSHEIRGAG